MGVQLIGAGGAVADVGEFARDALHVTLMPKAGANYRVSAFTGTIGAALAADSEVFQFRFLSGTKLFALVHKVEFEGMGIVAVATATGPLGFSLIPARAWSVAGSGGTRIAVSGDNLQMETALPNSQVNDIGIATTGALTAGTKTLDANAIGGVQSGIGTAAVTAYGSSSIIAPNNLFNANNGGDMPLVLANQEGFVIRTSHVGPTALTYVARFSVAWTEVTAY